MKKLPSLFLTLLLVACDLPVRLLVPTFSPSPVPTIVTDTPTYEQCAFNWATHALPELSTQVQRAMEAAGLTGINAIAEAYGEDCIGTSTGQAVSFSTMETDFRITAQVKDLTDRERLGALLEHVLLVLDGFPADQTPGPQPGYIGVTFQAGEDATRVWFTVRAGEAARKQDLHGAALLDALQNK